MNSSQSLFYVIEQQGTPSQHSEQGQNITAYGVVYKKTFNVKLSVPYSISQQSFMFRVIATLCYSLNREEIPAAPGGIEPCKNFTYDLVPENENILQVKCVINVLSSQHNKSHFRIRFQLADTRTNDLLPETAWTNPIWVVSKPSLTGGSGSHSKTTKTKSTKNRTSTPSSSTTITCPIIAPTCPILAPLPSPLLSQSESFVNIMDLIQRVIKGQEQHQSQLSSIIHHQQLSLQQKNPPVESAAASKKRRNRSEEEDIEEDFKEAFHHIKKPKNSEEREMMKKLAERFREEIGILYRMIPPTRLVVVEEANGQPEDIVSPVESAGNPATATDTVGVDFPDMEFFPQLDEFVWTE